MRPARAAAAALLLAGCAGAGAAPPTQAMDGAVSILWARPQAVEIDAAGRVVRLVPGPGDCVPRAGLRLFPEAAFAVIAPCDGRAETALRTVSVGAAPLFREGEAGDFRTLRAHLRSPAGLAEIGAGAAPGAARLAALREAGGTLYALVEEPGPDGPTRLWRAFAELNRRLVMVSAVDPSPGGDAGPMLADLAALMEALRRANAPGLAAVPTPAPRPDLG